MSDIDALEKEIKALIVDLLARTDLEEDVFDSDAELLGDGIGLDSLDILEVVDAIQDRYGVSLDIAQPDIREAFRTVRGIAQYLHRSGASVG